MRIPLNPTLTHEIGCMFHKAWVLTASLRSKADEPYRSSSRVQYHSFLAKSMDNPLCQQVAAVGSANHCFEMSTGLDCSQAGAAGRTLRVNPVTLCSCSPCYDLHRMAWVSIHALQGGSCLTSQPCGESKRRDFFETDLLWIGWRCGRLFWWWLFET